MAPRTKRKIEWPVPNQFRGTSIQDVLDDAEKTNFNDSQDVERFKEKHRAHLEEKPTDGEMFWRDDVLHTVSKKKRLGEYAEFVKWAIKDQSQLFKCKAAGGLTPLHLAIWEQNDEFVAVVLKDSDEIGALLCSKASSGMTCLHYAIMCKSPFTELIISKALEAARTHSQGDINTIDASLSTGSRENDDIFTALHKGEGYLKEMTALHIAAIRDLVPLGNKDPPRHVPMTPGPPSTKGKMLNNIPFQDSAKGWQSPTSSVNAKPEHNSRLEGTLDVHKPTPNTKALRRTMTGEWNKDIAASNKSVAIQNNDVQYAESFDLLEIVKKLIAANDRVLVDCKDAEGNTPFQARLAWLEGEEEVDGGNNVKSDATLEKERHELIEKDEILRYMRSYIIEKFDRREAMKALYKIGDERVLEFDLSGLPRSSINTEFLDGLGKVLRFEGLLKYVALPRLVVEDDEGLGAFNENSEEADKATEQALASKTNTANKGKGIQHMYSIFKWLRERNVKSVLKVTVIDDVEPSHSDEAIEACMDKLDVRIWNWYKVDLCCDVIFKSARWVRDVTLYSSGNNAVLVGWSSSEGLAKLPNLKRVHINVQEGLERPEKLKTNLQKFEVALKKLKSDVKFTWKLHKPGANYNSVFTQQISEKAEESKWMKAMREFAEFIKSAKPDPPVKPIKIAVIDDGIDTALDDFTGKIQVGESFYQLGELSGRRGAYYVPSGSHGTLMAQSICKVCPAVKLYIAQLETLPGQNGQRSFTAESATEAIYWAINQGVDIISMSWSINASSVMSNLENALRAAGDERIIMFCASIDEGTTAVDKTYPGRDGNVIKIGASTGSGAKLSWVSSRNSNFLAPGEAPHSAVGEGALWSRNPHPGTFGSSISTALAAGLAAVLLYCDRLIGTKPVLIAQQSSDAINTPNSKAFGRDRSTLKYVDFLRNTSKMKEAFETLSARTEGNQFLQVWDHLPKGPLDWNKASYPDRTKDTKSKLEEFMRKVKS